MDKTKVNFISEITPQTEFIQVAGTLLNLELIGDKRAKRLVAQLKDKTGFLELVWFQGISWVQKMLEPGQSYLVYGRLGFFQNTAQIVHPEIELWLPEKKDGKSFLEPVYPATEKLKARGLGGRQIAKLTQVLISQLFDRDLPENLPGNIIDKLKLIGEDKGGMYLFDRDLQTMGIAGEGGKKH